MTKEILREKIKNFINGLEEVDEKNDFFIEDNVKNLANNFPDDISNLSDNDLMLLWSACLKMQDYAIYKESILTSKMKRYDSIKKYVESLLLVYINSNQVENIKNKDAKLAWIKTTDEYIQAETDYINACIEYNKFKSLRSLYTHKIFICSRELTRRGLLSSRDYKRLSDYE